MDSTSLPAEEQLLIEEMPVAAMPEEVEAVLPPVPQSLDPLLEEESEEELIIEDFTIDGICGVY